MATVDDKADALVKKAEDLRTALLHCQWNLAADLASGAKRLAQAVRSHCLRLTVEERRAAKEAEAAAKRKAREDFEAGRMVCKDCGEPVLPAQNSSLSWSRDRGYAASHAGRCPKHGRCEKCGVTFTEKDVDGGRCLGCGRTIS